MNRCQVDKFIKKTDCVIRWIFIYLVDSTIHLSNTLGPDFLFQPVRLLLQLERIYPGYQRFFLACDEELSPSVGRPKPETAHEKSLAPRVARITSKVKNIPGRISLRIFRRMKEGKITQMAISEFPRISVSKRGKVLNL